MKIGENMNLKKISIIIGLILVILTIVKLTNGKKETSASSQLSRGGSGGRRITVNAEEVQRKDFRNMPVFTGNIKPLYDIGMAARITARIEKIEKKPGEFVLANEIIAYLENSEQVSAVAEAEASHLLARAQLKEAGNKFEIARKGLEQAHSLFAKNFISETQFDAEQAKFLAASSGLELAKAQLVQREANLNTAMLRKSYTTFYSPRAGLIGDIHFDEGSIINQNAIFTNVVVIDSVLCEIRVPETIHSKVKKGMSAVLERATDGKNNSHLFTGVIRSVSPVIDTQSRTAAVQILVPNKEHLLKPGMFARISLILEERYSVLAVPEKAITEYKSKKGIFSVIGDSTVTFLPVETGLSEEGFVEIITEKNPQKVVTEGQFMLSEGAKIMIPAKEKPAEAKKGNKK
jgi:RND family efflux transporter MFP subunit